MTEALLGNFFGNKSKLDVVKIVTLTQMHLCGEDKDSVVYKVNKIIYDLAEAETDFNRFVEKLKSAKGIDRVFVLLDKK